MTRSRLLRHWLALVALALVASAAFPTAAFAHGGATNASASELLLEAIAILEVHPAPSVAVEDKINDALAAKDQQAVRVKLLRPALGALGRGQVAATQRLLEQAVGACPDADILYVSDQRARPPCVAPAHAVAVADRSVGGASEVAILVIAAGLFLVGWAIIRHPKVRMSQPRGTR